MALGSFGAPPSNPTRGTYGQAAAPSTPSGWNALSNTNANGFSPDFTNTYTSNGPHGGYGDQARYAATPAVQQAQQAMGAYSAFYAPDLQQAQNQRDQALATGQVQDARYGQQVGEAQNSAALANRYTDNDVAGLGVDRTANANDRSYYQNLINANNQLIGNAGESFNNTQQALQQGAATGVRDTNSASTAAGNWLLGGRAQKVNDIFGKYNTDLTAANLDRRNTILGFNKENFRNEHGLKGADTQDQKLDLLGQRYGLDREKTQQTLDQGLSQLGYANYMNGTQLMDQLNSADAAKRAAAQKILQSVMEAGVSFNSGQIGDFYNSFGVNQ